MKKILIKGAFLFTLIGAFSSCDSDNFESKFDKSVTERTEERKQELHQELISSSDGWKMTYFTDDKELGGFTYLFKFEENDVTMISDVDAYNGYEWSTNPLSPRTSRYAVTNASSTINLLFNEANYIHLLSDNLVYPTNNFRGKGYKGDFQFLYYGKDAEGIDFLTPREEVNLRFERATAQDWNELVLNRNTMTVLSSKKRMFVIEGNNEENFNFNFNAKTRFALVLDTTGTMSVNANGGIGVGFQKNGIVISPAIEFEDGSVINELTQQGNQFIGQVGNNMVIIQ